MKKTLILFIDAFSFTDLKKENCPTIYNLAQEGACGSLTTIPSGYHIEYSMVSGCLPMKHNVWAWYYLNPNGSFSKIKYIKKFLEKIKNENLKRKIIDYYVNLIRLMQGKTRFLKTNKIPLSFLENFDVSVDKMHFEHNPLPVPTMFDVFRKKGIKYVGMEFPVISDYKKTRFYFNKGDIKEIGIAEKKLKKYDVVYLHIWGLDAIEHKYGLHSKEAIAYLKNIDSRISKLIRDNPDLNIILFSDHGGVNVKTTKDILSIFKKYDCKYFLGSTSGQIWLKDQSKKKELKEKLKAEGYLIYDETNIEKELFIPYKREYVGDLMAYVKPGEQIYPDFFRDTAHVKSMHGYTEKTPELAGTFIMKCSNVKKQKIKGMYLYDIAPTILKAMNLEIPKIWDGKTKI